LLSFLNRLAGLRRVCGWSTAVNIFARRALKMTAPVTIRPRAFSGLNFPALELRPLDSDQSVALQIFSAREYELPHAIRVGLNARAKQWRAEGLTPVIIDGGANTGYASVYFAEAYPNSVICAIEPNRDTFAILARHAAAHSRIQATYGALWEDRGGVELDLPAGGAWAARTLPRNDAGAADRPSTRVPSMTLADLAATVVNGRLLIVKLDIEGAERVVCAAARQVLRDAACIIIEPHDWMRPGAGYLTPLYAALAGKEMDTFLLGENLILAESSLAVASG
jgi:FkbM family methyltransferase